MNEATQYVIETIDKQIAAIANGVRGTILRTSMPKKIEKATIDSITKDIENILDYFDIRNKLLE